MDFQSSLPVPLAGTTEMIQTGGVHQIRSLTVNCSAAGMSFQVASGALEVHTTGVTGLCEGVGRRKLSA